MWIKSCTSNCNGDFLVIYHWATEKVTGKEAPLWDSNEWIFHHYYFLQHSLHSVNAISQVILPIIFVMFCLIASHIIALIVLFLLIEDAYKKLLVRHVVKYQAQTDAVKDDTTTEVTAKIRVFFGIILKVFIIVTIKKTYTLKVWKKGTTPPTYLSCLIL